MGVGGGVVGPPLVVWLLCGLCGVVTEPPEFWHEILGCLGQFLDLLVPKTQINSGKMPDPVVNSREGARKFPQGMHNTDV